MYVFLLFLFFSFFVPYKSPALIFPYKSPALIFPYTSPGLIFPYKSPGLIFPYTSPELIFPLIYLIFNLKCLLLITSSIYDSFSNQYKAPFIGTFIYLFLFSRFYHNCKIYKISSFSICDLNKDLHILFKRNYEILNI